MVEMVEIVGDGRIWENMGEYGGIWWRVWERYCRRGGGEEEGEGEEEWGGFFGGGFLGGVFWGGYFGAVYCRRLVWMDGWTGSYILQMFPHDSIILPLGQCSNIHMRFTTPST